jgi:hypothetical protein
VSAWWAKKEAAEAQANEIAKEIGATPGVFLLRGAWLEGFYRLGTPPKRWKVAGKKFYGYIKPLRYTAEGRAYADRMEKAVQQTCEDLAAALTLPPFFDDLSGHWCTAVGCTMRGGNFYLEYPACFKSKILTEGVTELKYWEYLRDTEDAK